MTMQRQLYVATRKGLFTLAQSPSGPWEIIRTAFIGDPVLLVLPIPSQNRVYAAMGLGHFGVKLRRSDDGGVTWQEIAAPAYPQQAPDFVDVDGMGRPLKWQVETIWALSLADPKNPDAIWCGTMPGGLFYSADAGASWSLNRPLWDHPGRKNWLGGGADTPGLHSICVDPTNHHRVVVGVSCGGVWTTEDAGQTWHCTSDGMTAEYMPPERQQDGTIQDPHYMVQCAAAPDMFWVQHHNGIYLSSDRARHWREIKDVSPSNFGFAVAVHPQDGNTAWFVPAQRDECRVPVDAQVCVTRTRDGGKTFEVLRRGLPQAHAYDLTFRHALDIDETGTQLAFGSTTGSLWCSGDQGDSWAHVSAHLPPIYCVRFAKHQ